MDTPSDDATAAMYETAVERLARMGIVRYEISNFARPGFESLHNLKYWQLEPYIGFGADAHSYDGRRRWGNAEGLEAYLQGAALRGTSREYGEANADERFFVGLRLMRGVTPDAAEWEKYDAPINRFIRDGLLERAGAQLRLTARGVMVSNEVFQEFLTA